MTTPRNVDSKREEFRKYLENSGVTDTIIRMLTIIFESDNRPINALEYLREQFTQSNPAMLELREAQKYMDSITQRVSILEEENHRLREELEGYRSKKPIPNALRPDK